MAEATCPSCGARVPPGAGQHALTPSAGVVACPSCGATVTLDKPGAEPEEGQSPPAAPQAAGVEGSWGQARGEEAFSGEETVEGVMDELRNKEGGPA